MTTIALAPLDVDRDLDLVHTWMQEPYVVRWWGLGGTRRSLRDYLVEQQRRAHLYTWIASADGVPFAYVETYRAAEDPLAVHYPARDGDRGFHLLVGVDAYRGTGVPRLLLRHILLELFGDPAVERVVCEPDVRNSRMLAFCRALGARRETTLTLPDKEAALLVWDRADVCDRWPDAGLARAAVPYADADDDHHHDDDGPPVHDVIGIGIGPFNLGLAALLDRVDGVDALFFDERERFAWHHGLMLPDAEIQVPFLADLVTLADPTSPWSFLNYLHAHGRLYRFYFHERFHVLRREFDAYCRWVADGLPSCRFGRRVESAVVDEDGVWTVTLAGGEVHRARHVVAGLGSTPFVPPCVPPLTGVDVVHSADYLGRRERLLAGWRVAVVGSGQSAAEVFCDLLEHAAGGVRVDWFTRSRGFLPMEYSKLGLEHFSPEYTRYFHGLPADRRDAVRARQDLLYKGIDAGTSERIYDALYRRSVDGAEPGVGYRAACELRSVDVGAGGAVRLGFHQLEQDVAFVHECDAAVLATGYRPARLDLIGPPGVFAVDDRGRPDVALDYRVRRTDGAASTLFVQNAELHTHGVGAPDLGLGAHRNAVIVNGLCGREVYPVRERNVFQSFGAPEGAAALSEPDAIPDAVHAA